MVFNFHIYLNKLSKLGINILFLWAYIILSIIINGLCPFYVTIMSENFF